MDINPDLLARIAQQVASHDALTPVTETLSGAYKNLYCDVKNQERPNALPFRDEAKLEVLVISDDNAENEGGAFDPKTLANSTLSGIIGPPNSAVADGLCTVAAIGRKHQPCQPLRRHGD